MGPADAADKAIISPIQRRVDCLTVFPEKSNYPIPTKSQWEIMHKAYLKAKDTDYDPLWDGPRMDHYRNHTGGLKVPYEVRQSPGKGRGLFVLSLIHI